MVLATAFLAADFFAVFAFLAPGLAAGFFNTFAVLAFVVFFRFTAIGPAPLFDER
jgi:hypothetical protein